MLKYIDLQRTFRDLTNEELEDSELLDFLDDQGISQSFGWQELLEHRRVILLAEAGAGKTREMRELTDRLVHDDQFAFFIPLESLDRESIPDFFSLEENENLGAWKASRQEPAWFLLDSVDELKLNAGTLERALRRLSNEIHGNLDRARIIVSCRPSDWCPTVDLTTVRARLPLPEQLSDVTVRPPEEVFITPLKRERRTSSSVTPKVEKLAHTNGVRTAAMLPMSKKQIRFFAEQAGLKNTPEFLEEIDRQNAWVFARRPLDLITLFEIWESTGQLGNRQQQHEANVKAKLREDPDRQDSNVLTDTKARLGAERLALALALTRKRSFRSPEQAIDVSRADGALRVEEILPDWTQAERKALLRRSLFDPATYGRVRFHHSSVQEYLAALRLKQLRAQGMSIKAVFRLLFAELYGAEVVFPSMRAIAAWLALWADAVCKELTKREPETLISLGDPESLSIAVRSNLVQAFVRAYGVGRWRGLNIPLDEVRRLSSPELASTIRECWGVGSTNDDVRRLLLEMIWRGKVEDCADLARAAALNTTWHPYDRVVSIRALLDFGQDSSVRGIVENMLTQPASWPDRIVHGVAVHLLPRIITVEELVTLMGREGETKPHVGDSHWAYRQIIENIEPWSQPAVDLRKRLAELVWQEREETPAHNRMYGMVHRHAPSLALLCDRQLSVIEDVPDADLVRACVVASRFGVGEIRGRKEVEKLRSHFKENAAWRPAAYWAELAFVDKVTATDDDSKRFFLAFSDGLTGHLFEVDRPWVERTVADGSRPKRRSVALHAWIQLWRYRGSENCELDAIREVLKDNTDLSLVLEENTAAGETTELTEEMQLEARQRKAKNEKLEHQRLEEWKEWRLALLADPEGAFCSENQNRTVSLLYEWLREYGTTKSRYDIWDKDALAKAFSSGIAELAESAFRGLWRTTSIMLWSARPDTQRNSIFRSWVHGLMGVSAEGSSPGWAARLSSSEARLAAKYATIEINGIAPFIFELAKSHAHEVEEVVGDEVSAQLRVAGDHDHLPIIQNLPYADGNLKQLLVPRLHAEVNAWPIDTCDETGPRLARHLDVLLSVLSETDTLAIREEIADHCASRYADDPVGALALTWLRGLFRFDATRAAQALCSGLEDREDPSARARAIESFAALFGDHGGVVFEIADSTQLAHVLERLVRFAFVFVRRDDDLVHEEVYSPNTRDHAETAREWLFSRLRDTPGPAAHRALLKLAGEGAFSEFSDRLRLLARQRAAADAEFTPLTPSRVNDLETALEAPPRDRDSLFAVMMDRLDDLDHALAHDDFSDRRTVRSISAEPEMQRTLASRLRTAANGAYKVVREEEVADRKSTDIRLLAARDDQKAVIEVKIADNKNWTLINLEKALRTQLLGQYLRHANCKAGCLLLTYRGKKKYWVDPDTKKRLTFQHVIKLLEEKARALEVEKLHDVRLGIFGIDLTEPLAGSV